MFTRVSEIQLLEPFLFCQFFASQLIRLAILSTLYTIFRFSLDRSNNCQLKIIDLQSSSCSYQRIAVGGTGTYALNTSQLPYWICLNEIVTGSSVFTGKVVKSKI